MKGDVLYRYAKLLSGILIDVDNLDPKRIEDRSQDFIGVSCGHRLIPVLGSDKAWHFRHAAESKCSGESYLHELGKMVFFQTYRSCLNENKPFNVKFPVSGICKTCQKTGFDKTKSCSFASEQKWNLVEKYKEIYEPDTVKDDEYKPDILLRSEDGDKIYIEIVVTHESTPKKLRSGTKIIEISLRDETDAQSIGRCFLTYKAENVKTFNFPTAKEESRESNYDCDFKFFIVDYKGICRVETLSMGRVKEDHFSNDILYYEYFPHPTIDEYWDKVLRAFRKHGNRVKTCLLCKYRAKNNYTGKNSNPIFCKAYKHTESHQKTCLLEDAAKCNVYSPVMHELTEDDWELIDLYH